MATRIISYTEAISEALHQVMASTQNVILFGLGVDDPKGIFGTTQGLQEEFGEHRVFDTPTAENAMTGVGIGAAVAGLRPIMVHQRLDFFLLAMDQLVNGAAKWHFMFGGATNVPITIRLIVGRGWGQGPTHSQNLQAWFAHIPGLKVVIPTSAYDAKGLLVESIYDDNPVIFIEHRWLHNLRGEVPVDEFRIPFGKCCTLRTGADISIVALSYMVIEALHAAEFLAEHGIDCEVIDLRTIAPLDWDGIFDSISKTRRVLVLDTASTTGSFAGEIITRIAERFWGKLEFPPQRLAMPDFPEATSYALTAEYHVRAEHIVEKVAHMIHKEVDVAPLKAQRANPHDVPGEWFSGPF